MKSTAGEYYDAVEGLDEYGLILCSLIKELLVDEDIQIQSIVHRVKDLKSVSRKLSLNPEKYTRVSELTDLLGVRVITYFPKDVDKVAEVIKKEFAIDKSNSEDKRKLLGADKFGYLSLHLYAGLPMKRIKLTEYKRFNKRQFELQIRSVLQHAWAEIEHDLGYKAEEALPEEVRRRFFRLAGNLELADEEFERLREEISKYEKRVDATIKNSPGTLGIDQSTVRVALETEKILKDLDQTISTISKRDLRKTIDASYVGGRARELKNLGVKDIGQLLTYAERYSDHIKSFATHWLGARGHNTTHDPFQRGIGLFYLCYVLAAQKEDALIGNWGLTITGRHEGLVEDIRTTWDTVIKEVGKPKPPIEASKAR